MPRVNVGTDDGRPVELHYQDVGTGRPVVLIHGWPLSGRSWEAQVGPLVTAGHRVVTYDRRGFGDSSQPWDGFGDSSQPWDGYDYDTFTADLHALLEHLDLRDVTLVGFSMGGGDVVRYIATHGTERVSRAVLAAAVPPYLYASADNPDGGLDDATIEQFRQGVLGDRPAFLDGFTAQFSDAGGKGLLDRESGEVSEQQRQYALRIAEFASPKGTLDCITAFGRTDFRVDVARVPVPTLVIHGDSDAIVPFEVSG